MSYKKILYEKDDHVVIITINRPEVHNCIDWETAKELQKIWQTRARKKVIHDEKKKP